MSNCKFVAFDVHAATTTFVVLNDEGKEISHGVSETTEENLTSVVRGLSGEIHLTFEEGTHADWLHDCLNPHVAHLLVCSPRKNKRNSENKDDFTDT